MKSGIFKFVFIICALMLLTACSFFGPEEDKVLPPATMAEGTVVEGIDVSGLQIEEAMSACLTYLEGEMDKLAVTVNFGEEVLKLTASQVGYTHVIDELLGEVILNTEGGSFDIGYEIDEAKLEDILSAEAEKYIKDAKNAEVEGFVDGAFSFVEDVDGATLDIKKLKNDVKAVFDSGKSGNVDVVIEPVEAEVQMASLQETYLQVSTYTTISTNNANGNHNMAEAGSRISGLVLQPGEVFSFHGTVGDSTYNGSGFLAANGIAGGEYVPMYGGGICQTSSTLYMAVLLAGLEIVERHPHAYPASYVPIGLDAMVNYNNYDFKFKNNFDTPIYLEMYMEGVELTANIYGTKQEGWDRIEVDSWYTGSIAMGAPKYIVDETMEPGTSYVKTYGSNGSYAAAERIFYLGDETVLVEELKSSSYSPMQQVIVKGPDATPAPEATPDPGTTTPTDPGTTTPTDPNTTPTDPGTTTPTDPNTTPTDPGTTTPTDPNTTPTDPGTTTPTDPNTTPTDPGTTTPDAGTTENTTPAG